MRSGAIAASARLLQIGIQLATNVVLARMLTPRDFGIQAMVFPLMILFNGIINMAFQLVVIQTEELGHRQANAMFWLGLRVNLVLAAMMAATGFGLARVYRTPEVVWVTIAWAGVLYFAASSAVPEALLKRQLRFGVVWSAQLVAVVVSMGAAIGAAAAGAGHWALMVQIAAGEIGRSLIVWTVSSWRPSHPREGDPSELRAMRGHWLNIGSFRLFSRVGDQLDRVVAGVVGGAQGLGLYETAKRWAFLPFLDLFLSLSDVVISSLSRVQSDPRRYRKYLEFALLGLLTVSLPAITFILLEGHRIILVLLGERWLGAAPFLRLMAVAAISASLMRPMQWLYQSRGESGRQLRWTVVTTPVMIAGALVGSRSGIFGVAVGFTVAMSLLAVPSLAYAVWGSPVTAADLIHAIGRPLGAALGAGGLMAVVRLGWATRVPDGVALGVAFLVYTAGYVAAWLAFPGGRATATELLAAIREIRGPAPTS